MRMAEAVNILGDFCGVRDVSALEPPVLEKEAGLAQADVMALFGGSILCGGDVLARAIMAKAAKAYVIVGGAGHTTPTLRRKMQEAYPEIQTDNMPEAEVFAAYLKLRYGLAADLLETASTNCGNNITNLLELLEKNRIPCESIILTQDATMQRRMAAGLRKHRPDVKIVNYAAYRARVEEREGALCYTRDIWGMWDMERYIELLLGEIPRLRDDENGYGPLGKGFIAHEDIPEEALEAFRTLSLNHAVRKANPAFSSRKP